MRAVGIPLALALGALFPGALLGCAATYHDQRAEPAPWRPSEAPENDRAGRLRGPGDGAALDVYVAAFGLRREVAERWPRLIEAGAGLGLGNRIAEALYAGGGFRLLEEKAELAHRLAAGLHGEAAGLQGEAEEPPGEAVPLPEAPWLLYGEVTDVRVRHWERVAGPRGDARGLTTVTVELRLVERSSRRALVATGSGRAESPAARDAAELDAPAVADATGTAVSEAVDALLRSLPAPSPPGPAEGGR